MAKQNVEDATKAAEKFLAALKKKDETKIKALLSKEGIAEVKEMAKQMDLKGSDPGKLMIAAMQKMVEVAKALALAFGAEGDDLKKINNMKYEDMIPDIKKAKAKEVNDNLVEFKMGDASAPSGSMELKAMKEDGKWLIGDFMPGKQAK